MATEPLSPFALARIRASVRHNPGTPAARTVQLLLDEIDRLKSPQILATWEPDVPCPLTRRQLEIVARTANGQNCEEIGPEIGIDPKSVRKNRQAVMRRLGVRTMPAAIAACLVGGWIPAGALQLPEQPKRVSPVAARNTYQERAALLRATPGEWGIVAHYDGGPAARQSAYRLRTGAFKAFRPAGMWEAEAFTHNGTHGVRARFIGAPAGSQKAAS
ncbi:helix-turn-helix transcriptional regulator [Streptomyces sp. NPDC102394]|uniref:helix-turn-helix transcriptional regulator n=1 Tax=Streptomyces sp. NPDC102394 TaxID=3366167 RepID=UPI00380930AF